MLESQYPVGFTMFVAKHQRSGPDGGIWGPRPSGARETPEVQRVTSGSTDLTNRTFVLEYDHDDDIGGRTDLRQPGEALASETPKKQSPEQNN